MMYCAQQTANGGEETDGMTWVRVVVLLDIIAARLAARKPVFWDRAAGERQRARAF